MLDLNALFEFSRSHCIGICAFLVPANLLATLQTMIFVGTGRPVIQVNLMTAFASLYSGLMVLHVATWLIIGIVMIPTFVLLSLGTVCLGINLWAIAHSRSMSTLLRWLWQAIQARFVQLTAFTSNPRSLPYGES